MVQLKHLGLYAGATVMQPSTVLLLAALGYLLYRLLRQAWHGSKAQSELPLPAETSEVSRLLSLILETGFTPDHQGKTPSSPSSDGVDGLGMAPLATSAVARHHLTAGCLLRMRLPSSKESASSCIAALWLWRQFLQLCSPCSAGDL